MSEVVGKRCSKCGETKPRDAFGVNRAKRDGLHYACKLCWNQQHRDPAQRAQRAAITLRYRQRNSAKVKEAQRRHRAANAEKIRLRGREKMRHEQGIVWAPGQSEAVLLLVQNGKCAVCFRAFSDLKQTPCADHDHSIVGQPNVRGLLCRTCNTGTGHLGDNPEMLEAGAAYLRRFKNVGSNATEYVDACAC